MYACFDTSIKLLFSGKPQACQCCRKEPSANWTHADAALVLAFLAGIARVLKRGVSAALSAIKVRPFEQTAGALRALPRPDADSDQGQLGVSRPKDLYQDEIDASRLPLC